MRQLLRAILRSFVTLSLASALSVVAAPDVLAQQASLINNALTDYNDGNYANSAFKLFDVYKRDPDPNNRMKAEYYLGRSFHRMDLFQPAMFYYGQILKAGPAHPYFRLAVEGLVEVKSKLHDAVIIPNLLDKYYDGAFGQLEPEKLNEINFVVGQLSYQKGKFDEAITFLKAVPVTSAFYPKALYLLGIVYVHPRKVNHDEAIKYFTAVTKLPGTHTFDAPRADGQGTERKTVEYLDIDEVQTLAHMSLGREHYTLGEYSEAITQYERVARASTHWFDSLFEISWAYFLNGDFGKALGALHSVRSPWFSNRYNPESFILRATIYYQTCLFGDSTVQVDDFLERYNPIFEQVKAVVDAFDPQKTAMYYGLLSGAVQPSEETLPPIPDEVADHLRRNPRFQTFDQMIKELDREAGVIASESTWRDSELGEELKFVIDENRSLMTQLAGKLVYSRLASDVLNADPGGLIALISQARILQFEISKAEKNRLESGVNIAELLSRQAGIPKTPSSAWQYYSFQDEYWLDELGSYQYTLVDACVRQQ